MITAVIQAGARLSAWLRSGMFPCNGSKMSVRGLICLYNKVPTVLSAVLAHPQVPFRYRISSRHIAILSYGSHTVTSKNATGRRRYGYGWEMTVAV